jgi:hypothetical protein
LELMMNQTQRDALDTVQLKPWTDLLEQLAQGAVNLTVGLIAGSRSSNERGALDRLAHAGLPSARDGLLVRLNFGNEAVSKRQLRSARASEQNPISIPSPLGKWREVSVPMQLGSTAPKSLERLPRWLSQWKRQHDRILIDLGPVDQPVCRAVGRYCDTSLLLLGPETCASPSWLRRHIDHLTQCDVTLSGSIVVATEHTAVAV